MNLKKKIKQNILTNLKNIITVILPNQDKILITPTQEQSSKNTHTQEHTKIDVENDLSKKPLDQFLTNSL